MFKPKKGQKYYMINSRLEVRQSEYTGSKKAKKRVVAGNAFKEVSEANVARYLFSELLKGNMKGFTRKPWWRFW